MQTPVADNNPVSQRLKNKVYKLIVEHNPDPILITTQNAEIAYANSAWQHLTGYRLSEVLGRNPRLLSSGKTPKSLYQTMWQALHEGNAFISEEVTNKKKNGEEFRIRSTIFPVIQHDQIGYYIQVLTDITDRKRLDDLKVQFLSLAAHELRTPITTAKLYTEILMERAQAQNESISNDLGRINQQLDRLTALVNDILDTTRIENGKLTIKTETCDICHLIEDIVQRAQIVLPKHKLVVQLTGKASARVDALRIEQVVINLLTNAAKHSPEGSTIIVTVKPARKGVVVSVKDKGEGIPKDQQPFLFDKFYQVKSGAKNGFGIGLYITKEILDRHNAKIWVRSAVGKGSTFFFTLPN